MIILCSCVVVCEEEIEQLLSRYFIWYHELGLSLIISCDGNHAEVVEQTHEIIRVAYLLGRKAGLELASHKAVFYQLLDDRGIVGKLLVLADEHAELVVIQSDVFLYHILRKSSSISDIIIDEIEHHVGIVHGGFAV